MFELMVAESSSCIPRSAMATRVMNAGKVSMITGWGSRRAFGSGPTRVGANRPPVRGQEWSYADRRPPGLSGMLRGHEPAPECREPRQRRHPDTVRALVRRRSHALAGAARAPEGD